MPEPIVREALSEPALTQIGRQNLLSARNLTQSTFKVISGSFTLSGGTVAVTFADAFSSATGVVVVVASDTANAQRPTAISASGFTANGTGSDTGNFIAIGPA